MFPVVQKLRTTNIHDLRRNIALLPYCMHKFYSIVLIALIFGLHYSCQYKDSLKADKSESTSSNPIESTETQKHENEVQAKNLKRGEIGKLYYNLADEYYKINLDTALYYANIAETKLSKSDPYDLYLASLKIKGRIYQRKHVYDSSLMYLNKAYDEFTGVDNYKEIASCANLLGYINWKIANYSVAYEFYQEGLESALLIDDPEWIARFENNLGTIAFETSDLDDAELHFRRANELYRKSGNPQKESIGLINLGVLYSKRNQEDSALAFFERVIVKLNTDSLNTRNERLTLGDAYSNIADSYSDLSQPKQSQEYLNLASRLYEEIENSHGLGFIYWRLGELKSLIGQNDSAIHYFNEALNIAEENEYINILIDIHSSRSSVYANNEDFQNAYMARLTFDSLTKKVFSETKSEQIANLKIRYGYDLQTAELDKALVEIKGKKVQTKFAFVGTSLVLVLLIVALRAYQLKRKDNRLLALQKERIAFKNSNLREQNDEILAQRDEIELQRDSIFQQKERIDQQKTALTDSIQYAKRIQSAILPPETYFTELLNENFILYKPRDIVSGDFYWIKQVNQYIVLVAADCTGHGVPGAFMSMLGMSYLNEIVQRREITQANHVLNELRNQIKLSLRQHGQRDESKDGIDMAICVLDLKSMKMQYAGANNPLYLIMDAKGTPELSEIKADRMPLGYYQGKDISFVNHDIKLDMGDTFYMFSDGFIDQKGGKDNKKFMSKNFKNLLLEIHDQSMNDQKEILNKTLLEWMGDNSQMDDILVVGVRV